MKYIVAIESYIGENTSRQQESGDGEASIEGTRDVLYAVILADSNGAGIVDDGYRSYDEAKASWPEAI